MKRIELDGIPIEIEKKKMKSLRMTVKPPKGVVHISAPHFVTYEEIRSFAAARMDWIRQQRASCLAAVPQYTDGDVLPLFGDEYRIKTISKNRPLSVKENTLFLPDDPAREKREQLVYAWYKVELAKRIPAILALWQPVMGVEASGGWTIRNMKSRWGSCNVVKRRVCFNLQLAKKPENCLEYVAVHELAHLLVPDHSRAFYECMSQFLPDWKQRKLILEGKHRSS